MDRLKSNQKWIAPTIFGMAGFLLVLFTTAAYGAGISGDAVDYISTADSLKKNLGFTDFAGEPYIYWPPLYPMLLAGISWLTSLDTFVVGWLLNAICFGLIVYMTGLLFRRVFGHSSIWFYFGSLAALTSLPLLQLAANITTDPLFIVLVLTYSLLADNYLENQKSITLLGLGLIAGAAAVLRWHGVILVFAVVLVTLFAGRKNPKSVFLKAAWAGLLASAPFALWVLGRNYRLLGSFMGYRDTGDIQYAHNISDSAIKIAHWLLSDQILRYIHPVVLVGGGLLFLILLNRKQDWQTFFKRLADPKHLPWLVFAPVYYLFVIYTSIAYDHPTYFDDRYYAPLFVFVFLLLALVVDGLILKPLKNRIPFSKKNFNLTRTFFILMALVWLVYPTYRLYKYVVVSRAHGEPTYNIYNTDAYHHSELIHYLDGLPLDGSKQLYSNYPAAVYFFTRQTTLRAPIAHSGDNTNLERLVSDYRDWPGGESYLIWFLPNDWHYYYEPQDLAEVITITELFSSKDGILFLVER
ncbi:MAG: hypothetical protein ISS57_07790 [Anaerolineales bacterium]|nr:hypothetical protein [Anaerolineales bacterium]